MIEKEFKILDDKSHLLTRPEMYCGSMNPIDIDNFIDGKLRTDTFSQALFKVVGELLDNSVEEAINTNFKFANKIQVNMTENSFEVIDNGRGIPAEKIDEKYKAEWAWCHARSGTSFTNDRIGISSNGIGSFISVVFSKKFKGESSDGNTLVQVFSQDNLNKHEVQIKKCSKNYTKVYAEFDFERFGIKSFSEIYFKRTEERLKLLSIAFPKIRFFFNGENISTTFKKYFESFSENRLHFSDDKFQFGFFTHEYEDIAQLICVNGLEIFQGGTLPNFFLRNVYTELARLLKRQKIEVTINEIKKSIGFVFIGTEFPNLKFTSQNKEAISNTDTEIKAYLGNLNYEKIAKTIFKSPLVQTIIDNFNARKELEAAKTIAKTNKSNGKVKSKKYTAATGNDPSKKILFLTEGASAVGQIKNERDPKIHGTFELKGKMMNIFGMKPYEILKNEECDTLVKILGLTFDPIFHAKTEDGKEVYFKERDHLKVKIGQKTECKSSYSFEILSKYFQCLQDGIIVSGYRPEKYGTVAIAVDGDYDGQHIQTLVLNFLFLWPELFIQKRVKRSDFFYIRFWNEQNKIEYTNNHFDHKLKKAKKIDHLKGLGSLTKEETEKLVYNQMNTWYTIEIDDPKYIAIMFSDSEIQARKAALTDE